MRHSVPLNGHEVNRQPVTHPTTKPNHTSGLLNLRSLKYFRPLPMMA